MVASLVRRTRKHMANVILRSTKFLAACIFLASCNSANLPELQQEVSHLAQVGMSTTAAVSRLGAAGFSCQGYVPVQCGRTRSGFMMTCVEQIEIFSDKELFRITSIGSPHIGCVGL